MAKIHFGRLILRYEFGNMGRAMGINEKFDGSIRKIPNRRKLTARLNALLRHNPLSPEIIRLKTQLGDVEIKIRDNIRSSQFQRKSRALNVIKSNPKYFYSYAKRFSKV